MHSRDCYVNVSFYDNPDLYPVVAAYHICHLCFQLLSWEGERLISGIETLESNKTSTKRRLPGTAWWRNELDKKSMSKRPCRKKRLQRFSNLLFWVYITSMGMLHLLAIASRAMFHSVAIRETANQNIIPWRRITRPPEFEIGVFANLCAGWQIYCGRMCEKTRQLLPDHNWVDFCRKHHLRSWLIPVWGIHRIALYTTQQDT